MVLKLQRFSGFVSVCGWTGGQMDGGFSRSTYQFHVVGCNSKIYSLGEASIRTEKLRGIGIMWTTGMRNVRTENSANLAMTSDILNTALRSPASRRDHLPILHDLQTSLKL